MSRYNADCLQLSIFKKTSCNMHLIPVGQFTKVINDLFIGAANLHKKPEL